MSEPPARLLGLCCGPLLWLAAGCAEPAAKPTVAAGQGAPVTACGGRALPDCPLQGWMKSTLQAYLNAGDLARLVKALEQLEAHPPEGFTNWAEISRVAAEAARAGDVPQVRLQCKACHEQHRAAFRAQKRTARLF